MPKRKIVFNEVDREDLHRDWNDGKPVAEIAESFGVSHMTLGKIRRELGLTARRKGKTWKPNEDAILRANYTSKSASEIGKMLRRSKNSVVSRAHALGLPAMRRAPHSLSQERQSLAGDRACNCNG